MAKKEVKINPRDLLMTKYIMFGNGMIDVIAAAKDLVKSRKEVDTDEALLIAHDECLKKVNNVVDILKEV